MGAVARDGFPQVDRRPAAVHAAVRTRGGWIVAAGLFHGTLWMGSLPLAAQGAAGGHPDRSWDAALDRLGHRRTGQWLHHALMGLWLAEVDAGQVVNAGQVDGTGQVYGAGRVDDAGIAAGGDGGSGPTRSDAGAGPVANEPGAWPVANETGTGAVASWAGAEPVARGAGGGSVAGAAAEPVRYLLLTTEQPGSGLAYGPASAVVGALQARLARGPKAPGALRRAYVRRGDVLAVVDVELVKETAPPLLRIWLDGRLLEEVALDRAARVSDTDGGVRG